VASKKVARRAPLTTRNRNPRLRREEMKPSVPPRRLAAECSHTPPARKRRHHAVRLRHRPKGGGPKASQHLIRRPEGKAAYMSPRARPGPQHRQSPRTSSALAPWVPLLRMLTPPQAFFSGRQTSVDPRGRCARRVSLAPVAVPTTRVTPEDSRPQSLRRRCRTPGPNLYQTASENGARQSRGLYNLPAPTPTSRLSLSIYMHRHLTAEPVEPPPGDGAGLPPRPRPLRVRDPFELKRGGRPAAASPATVPFACRRPIGGTRTAPPRPESRPPAFGVGSASPKKSARGSQSAPSPPSPSSSAIWHLCDDSANPSARLPRIARKQRPNWPCMPFPQTSNSKEMTHTGGQTN